MKKKDINLSDITASPQSSSGLRKPKRKTMRFLSRYKTNAPTGFGRRVLFLGLPTLAALIIISVLVVQIRVSISRQNEVQFEISDKNQFELDQLPDQEIGRDIDEGEIDDLAKASTPDSLPEQSDPEEPSVLTVASNREDAVKTVYANTVLNFRAAPDDEGAILGQLSYGEAVQQYSENNGWANIKTAQGTEGYAMARYLQDSKPASRTPKSDSSSSVRYVKVDMANIRTEPSEESSRVGFAQRGTVINVLSVDGDWAKIKTETGLTGYMSTKLYQSAKIEKAVSSINMGVDNWVKVNRGNLRKEADKDSEVIGSVRLNDKVFQISTDGSWSKVRLSGGQEGYLRNDLLTTVKPAAPAQTAAPVQETRSAPATEASDYRDTNISVFVRVAYANLRSGDSTSSAIAGSATQDEELTQLSTNGQWSKIKKSNGLVAYIANGLITSEAPASDAPPAEESQTTESSFSDVNKDAWVNVNSARVREAPNTSSATLTTLSYADKVTQLASNGTWSKIRMNNDKEGYIFNKLITGTEIEKPAAPEPEPEPETETETESKGSLRQQVVDKARSALGVRYSFGGASMSGFDCSGLTKWVYASFGYSLPHGSNAQGHNSVRNVSFSPGDYSNVKLGDLVFFSKTPGRYSHVGIYIGDGKMIHAPQPGRSVEVQVISSRGSSKQPTKIGRIIN